ncbi:MAG: helix-turn-helix domain-containing protein [Piscinibacter sp.]
MQELLARLKTLDPNASLALRVVACFDELVRGGVNTQGLLGAAASLSGCVAGCASRKPARTTRVSPNGQLLKDGGGATWEGALELDGMTVWLERQGPAHANDAMILERLALALAIRSGRRAEDPLRRLGDLLDADVDVEQRRATAAKLGLAPRLRYRVASLPLFATWKQHPAVLEDVVPTRFGPLHVCVLRAEDRHIDATPCGIGVAMGVDALHRSFSTALVSLRLCSLPDVPVVVADDYGGLVELLAQCSVDQPMLDVEELELVMQHPWAARTLDALLRSASVRDASRIADVHHSTMQARLETIRDLLPFDPTDGIGRTRVGLAYLAWRVRHSSALDLPPPASR